MSLLQEAEDAIELKSLRKENDRLRSNEAQLRTEIEDLKKTKTYLWKELRKFQNNSKPNGKKIGLKDVLVKKDKFKNMTL